MDRLVRFGNRLVADTEINELLLYIASVGEVIMLNITLLEGLSPNLMPSAYSEIITLINSIEPVNLLIFIVLTTIFPLFVFKIRLTFFRGLYLLCLRQCFVKSSLMDIIISIVTCLISFTNTFILFMQNTDTSYRSSDFLQYRNPSSSLITLIIKISVVIASGNSLPISVFVPFSASMLLLCLVFRFIYKSVNQTLHKFDVFTYAWLLIQLPMSFGFQSGTAMVRNMWIIVSAGLAGLVVLAEKKVLEWRVQRSFDVN